MPPPKELAIDAKWDSLIDLSLRRLVYGGAIAGLAGVMLFSELAGHVCPKSVWQRRRNRAHMVCHMHRGRLHKDFMPNLWSWGWSGLCGAKTL